MTPRRAAPVLVLAAATGLAACGDGGGAPDGRPDAFVDGPPDAFSCPMGESSCNALTNVGCNAGDKCSWVRYSTGLLPSEQYGRLGCVAAGSRAIGEACAWGASGSDTGYDDCVGGAVCVADPTIEQATGTCGEVCSLLDATAPCPATSACVARAGVFQSCGGNALAGTCGPTCDPLTQVIDADGAPACGSTAIPPDRACYGAPSADYTPTVFTCHAAGTIGGHGTPVPDPGVVNSCNPGSIPLLEERSGSMTIVCTAFCRPVPTNRTMPAGAGGASPYACRDVGATGATEECRYLWFFESPSTPITAASDAFGFCVDPTRYTWDHDDDGATPEVAWPSCRDTTDTDDPADPLADFRWGCVPTDAIPAAARRPARARP